jgi:two-component SAPR family response regulator
MKNLKINSTDLPKAKYSGWVEPVRLMMEKDKRTIEEFQEIFKYLKNEVPRENCFSWASNIRSTAKLREKFEVILKDARMKPMAKQSKVQNVATIYNNILQNIDDGKFN